jgi:medium-chain acyl-[acyl-carrier-protein] hydrolase
MFRHWRSELLSVDVCPVQLPGRETRWGEPAFVSLRALTQVLSSQLHRMMDKPFAFFGHSMGGLIAFELAYQVRKDHGVSPVHLFVSGARAPHLRGQDRQIYRLPDAEFLEKLTRLNGFPREISENAEMMQLLMPTLRADVTLCETYVHRKEVPLGCPITAYGGQDDRDVSADHVAGWGLYTNSQFRCRIFPGDHFFVESQRSAVLKDVSDELGVAARRALRLSR